MKNPASGIATTSFAPYENSEDIYYDLSCYHNIFSQLKPSRKRSHGDFYHLSRFSHSDIPTIHGKGLRCTGK